MRALICDSGLPRQRRGTPRYDAEYPDPVPPPGEALVRVRLAGICNTDLELVRGYLAFRGVLGHEFVGQVVEAADPSLLGQRVVGDINAACYHCETCLAGMHTHCPNRTTLGISGRDGAFADYLLLPQANLYRVPDAVSDEKAVFVEPIAAACEILQQVHILPTHRVLVLGDGKLGLLVAAIVRLTGADLTLVGRHPEKLAIAEAWGIPTHLDRGTSGALLDVLGLADLVVECTGNPSGFAVARRLLRPRGILVLKSTYHLTKGAGSRGDLGVDMSGLVVDEITLVGSRCGPFAPAMRLLEDGLIDPVSLISAEYPLAEGEAAFVHAAKPAVLKVLLRP